MLKKPQRKEMATPVAVMKSGSPQRKLCSQPPATQEGAVHEWLSNISIGRVADELEDGAAKGECKHDESERARITAPRRHASRRSLRSRHGLPRRCRTAAQRLPAMRPVSMTSRRWLTSNSSSRSEEISRTPQPRAGSFARSADQTNSAAPTSRPAGRLRRKDDPRVLHRFRGQGSTFCALPPERALAFCCAVGIVHVPGPERLVALPPQQIRIGRSGSMSGLCSRLADGPILPERARKAQSLAVAIEWE